MSAGRHSHRIEVFRPGTFTPMGGAPITFTAADLKALAAAYDPAGAPAPAVIGHPQADAPAYGWAKRFSFDAESERLVADFDEVEPQFADLVKQGRFKKISLSLFSPDAPNNPRPGGWYVKHVGFLGAAAPAVSGLKPVAFFGDGALTFEFADAGALRDVGGLFRSLREWMIEKFGSEEADRTLPGWTIGWIEDAAARDPVQPAFSEPTPEPAMTEPKHAAPATDDLARRQAALDERERRQNHADNLAFCEDLVAEGRMLPGQRDKAVALLDALTPVGRDAEVVSFAEGGATRTAPAAELVRDILKAQPKSVTFGRSVEGEQPGAAIDFAAPDGASVDPAGLDLHRRAVAWQRSNPGASYLDAVAAVQAA